MIRIRNTDFVCRVRLVPMLQGAEAGAGRQDRPDVPLHRHPAPPPTQVSPGPGQDVQPAPHTTGTTVSDQQHSSMVSMLTFSSNYRY